MTDIPNNVESVKTGDYTLQLSWSSPASNTPPVAGYEVFYAEYGSIVTQSAGTTNDTTISVTVPLSGTLYSYFVVAFSDADNALPSSRSSAIYLRTSKCNYNSSECILCEMMTMISYFQPTTSLHIEHIV